MESYENNKNILENKITEITDLKNTYEIKLKTEESFTNTFKNNFCKNVNGNLYTKLLSQIKEE